MPISRDAFKQGTSIEPLEKAVLDFLSRNYQSAYTSSEVYREVIRPDPHTVSEDSPERARVERILDTLMGKNAIVAIHAERSGEVYFAIANR